MSPNGILRFFTSQRARNALLLVAAFLPALFAAMLVDRFAVNIPVWDDWERVHLIEKFEEGEMKIADLYASHIEHRMVLPRIVTLALNSWTEGNLRAEVAFIFAIVVATAIAVFLLLRETIPDRPGLLYSATFCANLLLFSPLQWENFLWAVQVAFMLPMCCLCWAVVVLTVKRQWPLRRRFVVCLLLALAATHSFSHGMVVWPVVFMMALLQPEFANTGRSRVIFLGAWTAVAAVVLTFYFSNIENTSSSGHAYNQKPGEPPPGIANFGATIANPDKAIRFFGSFLGNPLARITRLPAREVAPWIGWTLAACFGAGSLIWLLHRKQKEENARLLPWLALGGTALTIALMVALGRAEIAGVRSALTPRYNSMSLYLLLSVSLLGILGIVRFLKDSNRQLVILSLLTGIFVMTQLQSWCYGIVRMVEWEHSRLHARTSLIYINHFLPEEDTRLDGNPPAVREQANVLNRYGYLSRPLLEQPTTEPFKTASRPLSPKRWALDRLEINPEDDALEIEGWTALPMSAGGKAAHGILITRPTDNPDDPNTVIQIASIHALPPMSSEISDNAFNFTRELDRPDFCRWSTRVPLEKLIANEANGSDGPVELTLFAVDARKMRIHPLGTQIVVNPDKSLEMKDYK